MRWVLAFFLLCAPLTLWADPDDAAVNVAQGNPAWVNSVQGEDAPVIPAWPNTVTGEDAAVIPAWQNTVTGEDAQVDPAWVNQGAENIAQPNVDMWQNY